MDKDEFLNKNLEIESKKLSKPSYRILNKFFEKISSYVPEINEHKNLIFINKYLHHNVNREYSNKLKTIFKQINDSNNNIDTSNIYEKFRHFFKNYNGIKIKNDMIKISKSISNNKEIEEFLLSFLSPISRVLNYVEYKNEYLPISLKHYVSLSKTEIENHFLSYLLREDNFNVLHKKYIDILKKTNIGNNLKQSRITYQDDILILKRSQLENYLEFFEKKKIKIEDED